MILLRNTLLTLLWPFGYVLSIIGKPEPRRGFEDYAAIRNIIKARPSDVFVLVSREDRKPTNMIIPGYWGHIAIYIGQGLVIDAIPPRVRKLHLAEWVMSVDSVALLRVRFDCKFEDLSNNYVGLRYNLGLFWARAWVCSMLVIDYLRKISVGTCPVVPRKTMGIETGAPQEIFEDRENFELMYEAD